MGSGSWGLRLSREIRSKDATHMLWGKSRLLIKKEAGGLFFSLAKPAAMTGILFP